MFLNDAGVSCNCWEKIIKIAYENAHGLKKCNPKNRPDGKSVQKKTQKTKAYSYYKHQLIHTNTHTQKWMQYIPFLTK